LPALPDIKVVGHPVTSERKVDNDLEIPRKTTQAD